MGGIINWMVRFKCLSLLTLLFVSPTPLTIIPTFNQINRLIRLCICLTTIKFTNSQHIVLGSQSDHEYENQRKCLIWPLTPYLWDEPVFSSRRNSIKLEYMFHPEICSLDSKTHSYGKLICGDIITELPWDWGKSATKYNAILHSYWEWVEIVVIDQSQAFPRAQAEQAATNAQVSVSIEGQQTLLWSRERVWLFPGLERKQLWTHMQHLGQKDS